ncbi:MAG: cytochrome c biogenesis protein CcsA [Acidimicrobiia bacterium]
MIAPQSRPRLLGRRTSTVLGVVALASMIVLAVLALAVVPADAQQGDAQRLMYVHVPTAWLAYLAFGVTTVASLLYLWPRTRRATWDRLAGASAEVGVVFTGLTLFLGAVWGKPIWGVWWTWDARLTTTAVLFFLYLGYLALRRIPGTQQQRAKRSAIAALIAFIDVPVVHMSVEWWRTLHQESTVLRPDPQISGSMAFTLVFSVVAFTLVYVWLMDVRYRLASLEEDIADAEVDLAIAQRTQTQSPEPVGAAQ